MHSIYYYFFTYITQIKSFGRSPPCMSGRNVRFGTRDDGCDPLANFSLGDDNTFHIQDIQSMYEKRLVNTTVVISKRTIFGTLTCKRASFRHVFNGHKGI